MHDRENHIGEIVPSPRRMPALPTATPPPVEEGRARDSLVEILWRQRHVVATCAVAFLVLGVLYLLVATRVYTSTSRLYVQRGGPNLLGDSRNYTSPEEQEKFLFTQREVIGSTPVLALTLGTPGLRELQTFEDQGSLFAYLKKNLKVEVGKKDDLISVSFDSAHPDEATRVVAAVVDAYANFQSSRRRTTAADALGTLKAEQAKWEVELAEKTKALLAFRQSSGVLGSEDERTGVEAQRVTAVAQALTAARLEVVNARAQYDEVERSLAFDVRTAERVAAVRRSEGVMPSAEDELALRRELMLGRARLVDLRRQYMDGHPLVRSAHERVAQLTVAHAAAVQGRWESARAREADLQRLYDREQRLAIDQSARTAEYARLRAETDRLQKLIDAVDSRVREVNLTDDGGTVTVTVLEPARAGERPSQPQGAKSLVIALVLGLAAGTGLACWRDRHDLPMNSPQDVRAALGLSVLGAIPVVSPELSPLARAQRAYLEPTSDLAEACRALRTAILFGAVEGRAKTILVASPSHGDGRTTVASNLAISLAQGGKRVLLVDADLRAPMQDWIFSVPAHKGLTALVEAGDAALSDLDAYVDSTEVKNLYVLPAGPTPASPAEVLNSPTFRALLDRLMDAYDHVVIDSPATEAGTDARVVAASCDLTLLVLPAGRHDRKLSESARDGLAAVGANVLGVVLNRVPSADSSNRKNPGERIAHAAGDLGRKAFREVVRQGRRGVDKLSSVSVTGLRR